MVETKGRSRVIPQNRFSLLLYRTCLLGCLVALTATLYYLAGLSGHIGTPVWDAAPAIVFLLASLFFLLVYFVSIPDKTWLGRLIWLLILTLLGIEVVLSLVPPAARDELTHHLVIPRLYVRASRIFEIPFAPYSYYPMLLDMLYAPWIAWGLDSIPKLIHGLFGFLTGLLLSIYLARRLSPTYGLLGFFFFISTPNVLRLSNLAYVDLGLTFYSTASLLCLLQWIENIGERRWLVLSGLSAGLAPTVKPNGFLVLLLLVFLLAFALGREKSRGLWETSSWVLLFCILAFIPLSPWLVKNMIWTGNPFFPFFEGFFGSEEGGRITVGAEGNLGLFDKRQLLYGESWWQIAALPLRVFFAGEDNRPQYFDGVLNPILVLFLPWAFRGKWEEEKKLLFGFALFFFLFAFFLVDLRIRYILPIVPPLVILLVYGIHNIYLRIAHPSLLAGGVILLLALNGTYLWRYFQEVSPLEYLQGKESREAYLTRQLPEYPAFQYINQKLPSAARIYLIFIGRRAYYCERDYFHDAGDNAWVLVQMIQNAQNERDIGVKLRDRGLTHLLVREDLLKSFLGHNLTPEQWRRWSSFADHHLQALFYSRGYSVYQIHG